MGARGSWRLISFGLLAGAMAIAACSTGGGGSSVRNRNNGSGANGGAGGTPPGAGGSLVNVTGGTVGIIIPPGGAFPPDPIIDTTSNPPITEAELAVFGDPSNLGSAGVCVYEPHLSDANGPGALFPMNWLRPRFRWTGPAGVSLWEIRLHAASQETDLVAYTRDTQWILPKELWEIIAGSVYDPITVTIRGNAGGSIVSAQGDFQITKALAGGSMIFWGTSSSAVQPGTSRLYSFTMGDEAVVQVLDAQQSQFSGVLNPGGRNYRGEVPATVDGSDALPGFTPGQVRCIGCHAVTPRVLGPDGMTPELYGEGSVVAFTDHYPWNKVMASVDPATPGAVPGYLTAGAQMLMKMPFLGTQTFNKNHWSTGDRILVTTFGRRTNPPDSIFVTFEQDGSRPEPLQHDLIWIDLETPVSISADVPGTCTDHYCDPRHQAMLAREEDILAAKGIGWGVIPTGITQSISNPDWSKSGELIAFSVSETSVDGHPDWHNNTSDIYTVPYNNRAGGAATPVPGASDPAALEYYPAFSPDDALIAFTRAPLPSNTSRCRQRNVPGDDKFCNNAALALGDNPDGPYYNRKSEIYITNGTPTPVRLRGNDPVACSGEVSPGVLNSWPKWSSTVREVDGKKYYFVIFSSARAYPGQFNLTPDPVYTPPISTKSSQLYMSTVEVDPTTGAITTYAAIYLWNQNYLATGPTTFEPLATSNLTPAWEDATVPAVPPGIVVPK